MAVIVTLTAIYAGCWAIWTGFTWMIAEDGSVWIAATRGALWPVLLPWFILTGLRDELRGR